MPLSGSLRAAKTHLPPFSAAEQPLETGRTFMLVARPLQAARRLGGYCERLKSTGRL